MERDLTRANPWWAVALAAALYGTTFLVCAACVAAPIAFWVLAGRARLDIFLLGFGAAFVLMRAVWPPQLPFRAPGAKLDLSEHNGLQKLLADVARQLDTRVPDDVYLTEQMHVFVAQYGGFWGLGARRYMGLGLPLVRVLDERELAAAIAHAYGLSGAGGGRVTGWVCHARITTRRALELLDARGTSLLRRPFHWYCIAFAQLSRDVSRAQQYVADQAAARVAGTDVAVSALHKVRGCLDPYARFWDARARPALSAGLAPPIFEAFSTAMLPQLTDGGAARLAVRAPADSRPASGDLRSTIPPALQARVDVLRSQPIVMAGGPGDAAEAGPASRLLELTEPLIMRVLRCAVGHELRAVPWSEAVELAFLPRWRHAASPHAHLVVDRTLGEVLSDEAVLQALARSYLRRDLKQGVSETDVIEEPLRLAQHPLRTLVLVAAGEQGYRHAFDERLSPVLVREDGTCLSVDALFTGEGSGEGGGGLRDTRDAQEAAGTLEEVVARVAAGGLTDLPLSIALSAEDRLAVEPLEGDPGVGAHYATLLAACQTIHRETTGFSRALSRSFYQLPEPGWVASEPEPARIRSGLKRQRQALENGKTVRWAYVHRANELLLAPGEDDSPGCLLYSPDPIMDDRPALLAAISDNLNALVSGELHIDSPDAQRLIAVLRTDLYEPGRLLLPVEISYGRQVFLQSLLIHRHVLVGGFLVVKWLPVVLGDQTDGISLLPAVEWGGQLSEHWSAGIDGYVANARPPSAELQRADVDT